MVFVEFTIIDPVKDNSIWPPDVITVSVDPLMQVPNWENENVTSGRIVEDELCSSGKNETAPMELTAILLVVELVEKPMGAPPL